jgi:hypothetical protein
MSQPQGGNNTGKLVLTPRLMVRMNGYYGAISNGGATYAHDFVISYTG